MLPMLFHPKDECHKMKGLCVNAIINAVSHLYACYGFCVLLQLSLLAAVGMFAAVRGVLSI